MQAPHGRGRRRPQRWLLPVLLVAQLMVILDITAVNIALPHIAADLKLSGSNDQLDDHELLADLRKPPALRRPRRRPARPPPDVPDRPRRLHRLLVRLGDGRKRSDAVRLPRRSGARRRDPLPGGTLDHHVRPSTAQPRAKALAAWGAVGGAGAAIGVLVGGVLTQFTDWRTIFYVNLPVAAVLLVASLKVVPADTAEAALARPRPRRRSPRDDEPRRDRLRDHPGELRRLDVDPDARLRDRRPRRARSVRDLRAAHRRTAAPRRAHRRPRGRRRPRAHARRRRLDLRALPALLALPPERARLGPARNRPRLRSARPLGRDRLARRRPRDRQARRPRPARRSVRSRSGRHVPALPRRRARQLPRPTCCPAC